MPWCQHWSHWAWLLRLWSQRLPRWISWRQRKRRVLFLTLNWRSQKRWFFSSEQPLGPWLVEGDSNFVTASMANCVPQASLEGLVFASGDLWVGPLPIALPSPRRFSASVLCHHPHLALNPYVYPHRCTQHPWPGAFRSLLVPWTRKCKMGDTTFPTTRLTRETSLVGYIDQ